MTFTPDEIALLQHAIGLPRGVGVAPEERRNHFCATNGSPDDEAWSRFVTMGLAVRAPRSPSASLVLYHVTPDGRRAAGEV